MEPIVALLPRLLRQRTRARPGCKGLRAKVHQRDQISDYAEKLNAGADFKGYRAEKKRLVNWDDQSDQGK